MGTGGALINALSSISSNYAAVLNGDTYFTRNLPKEFALPINPFNKIGVRSLSKNDRYGAIEQHNGNLIFTRGTDKNTIMRSKVYAGIAIVPKLLPSLNLTVPFSTEALFEEVTPILKQSYMN